MTPKLNCTSNISKYSFCCFPVNFMRSLAYNRKHDQWKRKGQDGNESSIKDYQQADDTRWHLLQGKFKWQKV